GSSQIILKEPVKRATAVTTKYSCRSFGPFQSSQSITTTSRSWLLNDGPSGLSNACFNLAGESQDRRPDLGCFTALLTHPATASCAIVRSVCGLTAGGRC